MLSFFAYGGLETCLSIKKREYIRQEHFVRDPVEMIQRGRERINIRNLAGTGISQRPRFAYVLYEEIRFLACIGLER